MSIFDQAKEKAEELVEKAEELVEKVKGKLTDDDDSPKTIPSDGAVTPADVAQTVADPELPHPDPPSGQES